jgi:hypothetical protein
MHEVRSSTIWVYKQTECNSELKLFLHKVCKSLVHGVVRIVHVYSAEADTLSLQGSLSRFTVVDSVLTAARKSNHVANVNR